MKFLATMLLLCVAVGNMTAAESHKEHFRAMVDECKTEHGATDADVEALFKHQGLSSPEAKCMRACALKKGGLFSEEGKPNKAALLLMNKMFAKGNEEKEKVGAEVVDECQEIELPKDDHCEAAEVYAACLRLKGKEKGMSSMEFDDE